MTVTLGQPLSPDWSVYEELLRAIAESGRWTNDGLVVRELETRLATDLGWSRAAATSSGTTALTTALLALELPPGSEVITTALTFAATVHAITAAALVPVFAAVDPDTLLLDPAAVQAAVGPRTAAILPVHLFGLAVDPAVDAVGAAAGLPVIFDAAHAYGFGPIAGRGTAAAYSLHATKLLHTGEGGLVTTDDPALDERVRRTRNFGLAGDAVVGPGLNAKLPETSAALGLGVRARLAAEMTARQQVRDAYGAALVDSRYRPHAPGHSRALVMEVVRCEPADQQRLLADLAAVDVVGRRFPSLGAPGQRFESLRREGTDQTGLADTVVAVPLHGRITDEQLEAIVKVLRR